MLQFSSNGTEYLFFFFLSFSGTTLSEHGPMPALMCDSGHLEEDASPRVRNGSRLAEL